LLICFKILSLGYENKILIKVSGNHKDANFIEAAF
jgi:hypothetical protein